MKQKFNYGIPIVVLLALIFAIASDYCRPLPLPEQVLTITAPKPFNPFCYVADFKPEAPEIINTYDLNGNLLRPISNSFVGTANPTLSGYTI